MGSGYFILLWDGWGSGLVRINPRLHTEGTDEYGNPVNWWPRMKPNDDTFDVLERHGIDMAVAHHVEVFFDDGIR